MHTEPSLTTVHPTFESMHTMATSIIPNGAGGASDESHDRRESTSAVTAFDFLDRMSDIAVHWWSLIDSALEQAQFGAGRAEPAPQWLLEILKDGGKLRSSEEEHSRQLHLLRDFLHLASGDGSKYRYEIWNQKGFRIENRLETYNQAAELLREVWVNPKFADAFVARVHIRSSHGVDDAALLDTLIGRVRYAGLYLEAEGDEIFEVMDDTGRTVKVASTVLRAHPVFERMSERGKAAVEFSIQHIQARPHRGSSAATGGEVGL